MFNLEVGQELEFTAPVQADGEVISKGTRVRVGFILSELVESQVTLVVLDEDPPRTLQLPRHVVTLHCRPVAA
jgi:hypothetical protein